MREIKFRAWDIKFKTMRYSNDDLEIAVAENRIYQLDSEPYGNDMTGQLIPLQYTGRKDKNGKEIWEGDIYKTEIEGDKPIFVVEFINGGFSIAGLKEDIEVIGNIYENPELLI